VPSSLCPIPDPLSFEYVFDLPAFGVWRWNEFNPASKTEKVSKREEFSKEKEG